MAKKNVSLYSQVAYIAYYQLDTTSDSVPGFLHVDLFLDTGLKLNEYPIEDIDAISQNMKMASKISFTFYREQQSKKSIKKFNARLKTSLYEGSFSNFFEEKYKHITTYKKDIVHDIIQSPSNNIPKIVSNVSSQIFKELKNFHIDTKGHYYDTMEQYTKDLPFLEKATLSFPNLFKRVLAKEDIDWNHEKLEYTQKVDQLREIFFKFSHPHCLEKILFRNKLNEQLREKENIPIKFKKI